MKKLTLISALTLLTAVAASGCRSDGFQKITPATSSDTTVSGTVPQESDPVLPTTEDAPSGGTPTDTTTTDPVVQEEPFVSPTGSDCYRYLFVSTRDGYENIYSASTCSKDAPTQVTRSASEDNRFRNIQISGDGKKVSYDYLYAGVADWQMSIDDIGTLGFGGENISGCRSAALSPSNDRVVYVCASGLYFTDERDLTQTRLIASGNTDTRVFEKAVWSPVKTETDASYDKVVFSAKESDGSDKLYVYDAKTSRKTRPLYEQYSGDGHDVILKGSSADISPDGKTLTFVRKNSSAQDQVWACDLMFDQVFVPDNSVSTSISHFPTETKESLCVNPRVLTSEGNNLNPHWTSNGHHVFFTSDRDGNKEAYAMKADGSEEANLTQGAASDRDVEPFPSIRTFDVNAINASASLTRE